MKQELQGITISQEKGRKNDNYILNGYIIFKGDGISQHKEIMFNPLTALADIPYIAEDMSYHIDTMSAAKNELIVPPFVAPYKTEKILEISVEKNTQYFVLLEHIKEIIYTGKQLSFSELYRMERKHRLNYDFSYKQIYSDYIMTNVNSPKIYDMPDISEPLVDRHIFICSCKSASEVVFAIFFYLMINGYYFFRCAHCGRYIATKNKQGTNRYCNRKNLLSIKEYDKYSCKDGVTNLLNTIRKRKKRIYNYLYNFSDEIEVNDFLADYNRLNDMVKKAPTAENLENLYQFVDKMSVRTIKQRG